MEPTTEELPSGEEQVIIDTPAETEQSETVETSSAAAEEESKAAPEDSFTTIDPATLPEEVRPFYNSMQADYTKKMQANALVQARLDGIEKALVNKTEAPAEPVNDAPDINSLSGEQLVQKIIDEGPQFFRQLVKEEAKTMYGPLEDRIYQEQAAREYSRLTALYPDDKYGANSFSSKEIQVTELMGTRNIDAEDAYKLLTWDSQRQVGANLATDTIKKRDAAAPPKTTSPAKISVEKKFNSVREAYIAAAEEHGLAL